MAAAMIKGQFAHVVGTFDLAQKSGTIDYVTPVRTATESTDLDDEGIHLVGEDGRGISSSTNLSIRSETPVHPTRREEPSRSLSLYRLSCTRSGW